MMTTRYGIQGLPRPRYPMLIEVARVLWLLPAVRWLCLLALLAAVFLAGFMTGAGCESTRHRVEVMPSAMRAAYKTGYDHGLSDGMSRRATRAYHEGLLEGAQQMLNLYEAEGGRALRPQVRLLRGLEPQER